MVEQYRDARSVIYGVVIGHVDKQIFCGVTGNINFIPSCYIGIFTTPTCSRIQVFPEWIASISSSARVADFLGIRDASTTQSHNFSADDGTHKTPGLISCHCQTDICKECS